MAVLHIVVIVLAAFVVVGTLLPFSRSSAWQIRLFDFPRLQLAILGALVFATYVAGWGWSEPLDWVVLVPLALALGYQAARMVQYSPLYPKEVQASDQDDPDCRLRLVVSNVLMSNRESGKYLQHIEAEDPDLVLAVETDSWWEEHLDGELCEAYPHTLKCPLPNTYGMLLYSRLPLEDPEIRFMVEDEVPSMWLRVRLPSGERIRLICVHPRPPRPDIQQDSAQRDAELLLIARELEGDDTPTLVAGDLNDVAWSHTTRLFQRISGMLDPRVGRGLFSTFHAEHVLLRWPLDHIFITEHFRLFEMKRLGYVGSDHFPVLAEFSYEPQGQGEQDALGADTEDRDDADHMIAEGTAKVDAVDKTGSEGIQARMRAGEPVRAVTAEMLERAEEMIVSGQ